MALKLGELSVDLSADTNGLKKADKEVNRVSKKMDKAFKRVGIAIGAAISLDLARRVILVADNLQVLERRLIRFTGDADKAGKAFRRLVDTASDSGVEIESTVKIFERFSLIRNEIGATNEQVLTMTDTLSKMGALGGSSSDEIKNSLRQLSQALTSPIVRAEEFNSVIDQTPIIIQKIANSMGISMGQIKKDMLDGKLVSQDVFKAILKAAETTNAEFESMPKSIQMVTQALENELVVSIKNIDASLDFSASISRSISKFTELVKEINEGVEAQKKIEEQQKRINALLEKSTERPTSRRGRRTTREDTRSQAVKDANELNDLLDKNLAIQEQIDGVTSRGGAARAASRKKAFLAEIDANNIRIEQLKKESEVAQKIADIRAGVAPTAGAEEEKAAKPAKTVSKKDQKRLDKLKNIAETEREGVLRIEEERRAFILTQEQLTEDARLELLESVGKEREKKMREINDKLDDEEERHAKASAAKRQEVADNQIAAVNTAAGAISNILSASGDDQAARAARVIDGVASLATTIVAISAAQAQAQAASDPTAVTTFQKVANIAVMASQFAGIFSALKSAKGGGRQFGGNVSPGLAHPINEAGVPEILNQGGKQFLLPTGAGGTIAPLDGGGGGNSSGQPVVNLISNGTNQAVEGVQASRGEISIMINDAVRTNNKSNNAGLASGRGDMFRSLQKGSKIERNLR